MARVLPELGEAQLRSLGSRAEAKFYEACRDQLPADALVIHSAAWVYRDSIGVREGEADFVIALPRFGLLVVEVKGGGVSFDAVTGHWHSVDRTGVTHPIKDPFRQAARERHALRHQIEGHQLWRRKEDHRLVIGHAVFLPDIETAKRMASSERPLDIIGCRKDLEQLKEWVRRVEAFWQREDAEPLGSDGVQLVERILRDSLEVKPVLKPMLDDVERERIKLTANQAKVLRIIGGRKRAVISGGAGTGKTVIAAERARRFSREGKKVLLLCYNRPLADVLSRSLAGEKNLQVFDFHQLCVRRIAAARSACGRDLLVEAREAYPGKGQQHLFDVQLPFAMALSNEILEDKYDAIVVDEAQDFSPDYWFTLDELLNDAKEGFLYIFIDENQSIYKRHSQLPVKDEPYYLTSNCRNTAAIHSTGYVHYKGEPVDPPELEGTEVERLCVEGSTAQARAVISAVSRWISEGVAPGDIAVLVARRPKEDSFRLLEEQTLVGGIRIRAEEGIDCGKVQVYTVAKFKGLEAQAVVLWLGDEVALERQNDLLYVGVTRAKTLLSIVGSRLAMTIVDGI